MTDIQGNTPPHWTARSTMALCFAVVGGIRQNIDKIGQIAGMLFSFVRPSIVRARLERLVVLEHCTETPTLAQLLVASRHQLSFSLGADTKAFYAAQGIPWTFHNLRRFVAYPTTMMDPVGLFSPRDSIIHHVLQTFHRHATYDLVLLRAHEGGLEEMQSQLDALAAGTHPHQSSLDNLVEDGSYHDRLRRDVPEFAANPHIQARPIPEGLAPDPWLMLAMEQFKDVRGYTNYASRLHVGPLDVIENIVQLVFNETIGEVWAVHIGPKTIHLEACDPDFVAQHLPTHLR